MKQMTRLIKYSTDNLVKHMDESATTGEAFEAKIRASAFTMDVIASTAFGIQIDSQENPDSPFLVNGRRAFSTSPFNIWILVMVLAPFLLPILEWFNVDMNTPPDVVEFFTKIINEALEERRNSPEGHHVDFLKLMLDAEKHLAEAEVAEQNEDDFKVDKSLKRKGLTNEEILAQSLVFFLAGFETTATAMSFLMYNLATHPECQKRVIAEVDEALQGAEPNYENVHKLSYLQMCIDETLRLYPPVARMDRRAKEGTTIGGVHFPKDMVIILPFYALHRDPDAWPEPENFDPERFTPENRAKIHPYQYMPFGLGPRNCIGMRLALLELRMAFAKMLQKFTFTTCEKTQVPLKLKKAFMMTGEKGIWLTAEHRKSDN